MRYRSVDGVVADSVGQLISGPLLPRLDRLLRWASDVPEADRSALVLDGVSRVVPEPPPLHASWSNLDPDEAAAALLTQVRRAIERAVAGRERVAIALGGVDSSVVLAVLRWACPDVRVEAFTLQFSGGDSDLPYATELCASLDVPLHVVPTDQLDPTSALVMDRRPFPSFGGCVDLEVARAAKDRGFDVVLNGVYGDDVLGGPLQALGSSRLFHAPLAAIDCALRVEIPDSFSMWRRVRVFLVGGAARRLLPRFVSIARLERSVRARYPWLTEEGWAVVRSGVPLLVDDVWRSVKRPADYYEMLLVGRAALAMLDATQQMDVESGVHSAVPLGDPECVGFAAALPPELLSVDHRFRGLIRRAVRGLMPERVRLRSGKADAHGEVERVRSLAAEATRPYWELPRLAAEGWVDPSAFRTQLEHHGAGDPRLWPFLAAEAFLDRECR